MKTKPNIFDLGYIYFSVGLEFEKKRSKSYDKFFKGYVGGFIYFMFRFFYSLLRQGLRFPKFSPKQSQCLFVGLSNNNRRSLQPIINSFDKSCVGALVDSRKIPMWRMYWHAIPYLGYFINDIRKATPEQREIMRLRFLYFWRGYGCPGFAKDLLDFYNPKVLVVANDHLFYYRALIKEANKRGVNTIYVQHAAVTDKFPPLEFTYSFLDGKDSFEKYASAGDCKGNVFLLGGVRFDAISHTSVRPTNLYRVGVALNLLDDTDLVKEACIKIKNLKANKPIEVVLRPHPAVLYKPWVDWCHTNDIKISLPSEQSSFDYLESLSLLVSNQSSIHLDAAMCHTPSIIYNLATTEPEDGYGFLRNSLVNQYFSIDNMLSVLESLNDFMYDTETVRLYNGSYGAHYEGHVASTIADIINHILKGDIDHFIEDRDFNCNNYSNKLKVYSAK